MRAYRLAIYAYGLWERLIQLTQLFVGLKRSEHTRRGLRLSMVRARRQQRWRQWQRRLNLWAEHAAWTGGSNSGGRNLATPSVAACGESAREV
eukprot:scaffold17430_cov66-Phaeocystis_antarctica.AAC.1